MIFFIDVVQVYGIEARFFEEGQASFLWARVVGLTGWYDYYGKGQFKITSIPVGPFSHNKVVLEPKVDQSKCQVA